MAVKKAPHTHRQHVSPLLHPTPAARYSPAAAAAGRGGRWRRSRRPNASGHSTARGNGSMVKKAKLRPYGGLDVQPGYWLDPVVRPDFDRVSHIDEEDIVLPESLEVLEGDLRSAPDHRSRSGFTVSPRRCRTRRTTRDPNPVKPVAAPRGRAP